MKLNYRWIAERVVPRTELQGRFSVIHPFNAETKTLYRVMIGADSNTRQI